MNLLLYSLIFMTISFSAYGNDDINITDTNITLKKLDLIDTNNTNITKSSSIQVEKDKITPEELYTSIQKLAVTNHLLEAISEVKEATKKYHDNIMLNTLYAKLLFWNKEPSKAKELMKNYKDFDNKLYNKIYIAWAIDELKSKKSNSSKLKFIDSLELFAQSNYDILWKKIDANIRRKYLKTALTLTKKLVKKYPESKDAQERLAKLLFWNRHYYKSLKQYRKISKIYKESYKKEISQLRHIIYRRYIARKKRELRKKELIKKATLALKKYEENSKLAKKHMIGVGYKKATYSDNRYKDYTDYIEGSFDIFNNPLYIRIENTHRYGLHDTKIEGEFYPTLPKPQWGYFSFSFTPNAKFFSKYSLGWYHYYSNKAWQFGVGYSYSKYKIDNIKLISAEYSYYLRDTLYTRQNFKYVPSNKSWAILTQIKQETTIKTLGWHINFTIAHSNERIEDLDIFTGTDNKSIEVGLEYPIVDNFTIGTNIKQEWSEAKYTKYKRANGEIFLRYYW